jgi:hypothetical protein
MLHSRALAARRPACAAAIAPIVQDRAVAAVAAMAVAADDLDEFRAAELFGQSPGRGFIDPHQRRVNDEASVHAEIERDLQRLERVVAAIGITREIRLAHAGNEMLGAAPIGDDRRKIEKDEIAARHEGRRQAFVIHGDSHFLRQRALAERPQHAEVDHVIGAEPVRPNRLQRPKCGPQRRGAIELDRVALAIAEADRLDARETVERPGETCRRILTAGKQDQRLSIIEHRMLLLSTDACRAYLVPALCPCVSSATEPCVIEAYPCVFFVC